MPINLTNLQNLKTWLAIASDNTASDAVLSMILTRVSAQTMAYLERRTFVQTDYLDFFDGQGSDTQFVENWPVSDVSAVTIDGRSIPAASIEGVINTNPRGFRFEDWDGTAPGDPTQVELIGYRFIRGKQNVSIAYTAGYGADETLTVASSAAVTEQPNGIWISDGGVRYALTGAPLTAVPANPAQGQYSIDPSTLGGYLFNAADDAASALVSYSWCPYAVEQVVLEWCNEVYTRRSRPGQNSRSLAGQETVTYDNKSGVPNWAVSALQPFKTVLPL